MLECDIDSCQSWYHLSCIQWDKSRRCILISLTTGTKDFEFICEDCFSMQPSQYTNEVPQAFRHIKERIESIKKAAGPASEEIPEANIPESPPIQEHRPSIRVQAVGSWGLDNSGTTEFELAREEAFQGFQQGKIMGLLQDIDAAIYNYDREVHYTNKLYSDGSDVYMDNPLSVWNVIDAGHDLVEGSEWFRLDDGRKNLSIGHHPITAALRLLLSTSIHRPLCIAPELKKLNFSQVHIGLIYWFVFDLLNNELNFYDIPNMKPLRAMMSAVADFGNASMYRSQAHFYY